MVAAPTKIRQSIAETSPALAMRSHQHACPKAAGDRGWKPVASIFDHVAIELR
jgi:hypothetical protein